MWLGFVLVFGLGMLVAQKPVWAKGQALELFEFRASQLSVFQSGGSLFSGIFTWNPGFWITDHIGVRLSAGGSLLKSRVNKMYPGIEAALLGTLSLSDSLALEAGGGLQYWMDNGGSLYMAQANAVMPMKSRFLYIFDSIVAGYAMVFVPTNLTHEIRIGAGF